MGDRCLRRHRRRPTDARSRVLVRRSPDVAGGQVGAAGRWGLNAYETAHVLHVLAALSLTATFGVEAAGLLGLRGATRAAEALAWARSRRWVLAVGPASIALLLATGVYMAAASWGAAPWVVVSLAGLVASAAVGGFLTGIPMARLTRTLEQAHGQLPESARRSLRTPLLTISFVTRVALVGSIAFLMVEKPPLFASLLTVVAAAGVGAAAGLVLGSRLAGAGDAAPAPPEARR